MLDVSPILKKGRAEIRLRNSGQPPIVVNKILFWREGRPRPEIRDLLSGQFIHVRPHTAQAVDITEAMLAMTGNTGAFAVWMVFELDPHCQRFPVRYELDIDDGRVTRFIEQYPE